MEVIACHSDSDEPLTGTAVMPYQPTGTDMVPIQPQESSNGKLSTKNQTFFWIRFHTRNAFK